MNVGIRVPREVLEDASVKDRESLLTWLVWSEAEWEWQGDWMAASVSAKLADFLVREYFPKRTQWGDFSDDE